MTCELEVVTGAEEFWGRGIVLEESGKMDQLETLFI